MRTKDEIANYNKQYRKDHQEYYSNYMKKWRKENKDHVIEYAKDYRLRDPEKWKEYEVDRNQRRRAQNRYEALKIYGFKCQECNNLDIRVLQFHHKNNQGKKREKTGVMHNRIKRNGKLNDIELLCANCHILADVRDKTANGRERHSRVIKIMEENGHVMEISRSPLGKIPSYSSWFG